MTFILEEDEALRKLLQGMTVSDDRRANRPVDVWFGQPDLELQARTYPYISIELIDLTEANERVMVGKPFLTYVPDGYTAPAVPADEILTASWFPTPYDLDYQVSVWSRHPRHDRALVSRLLSSKLPLRFGQLSLPDSNRLVRLDVLDGPQVADTTDEAGKRLFRKVFHVRVATELFPDSVVQATGLVKEVHVNPTTQGEVDPDFVQLYIQV